MFQVELETRTTGGRMTIRVKADSFIEGERGITFTEFGSRAGATGHHPVKWLPSTQVISISWEDR